MIDRLSVKVNMDQSFKRLDKKIWTKGMLSYG